MSSSDYAYFPDKGHSVSWWTSEAQMSSEAFYFLYDSQRGRECWYAFHTTYAELGDPSYAKSA